MAILVRELPRLALHVEARTPSGRRYRWGQDERRPENVPAQLRFGSTMPGGFDRASCVLARQPRVDYADLERFTTLRVLGPGGDVAGEYRLEQAPSSSGEQMAISPAAVGWQAALEDDKSAQMIYIDRDLGRWTGASREHVIGLGADWNLRGPSVELNPVTGLPALLLQWEGAWASPVRPDAEAWYDAGPGNRLARLRGSWAQGGKTDFTNANFAAFGLGSSDDVLTATDLSSDLQTVGATGTLDLALTRRRFAALQFYYGLTASGADGFSYELRWSDLRVIGDHGLTLYSATSGGITYEGVRADDAIAHAVRRWAPALRIAVDGIQVSTFVIAQLAFPDPTTAGEIVRQCTRFTLADWAVWDDRAFVWHQRGGRGRRWRARVGPAQLEQTGPQADRLWNSVLVTYQDASGKARTVGPPGSGADYEDARLVDTDPENPANQLGLVRREQLTMQASGLDGSNVPEPAIQIGQRFLEEQKQLDRSGRARLVGHVEDDRGVIHPYWRVRAGDQISFSDAADTSYRRIVRVDHDEQGRAATVDLDAPPEGLQALLERLGVTGSLLG